MLPGPLTNNYAVTFSGFLATHIRAFQHLWIHDIDWLAVRVGNDLIEDV
jgi:hypothetical protein